ncbi:hypothetical protein GGR51DRAFT_554467 [Nemania sp. FL0031]|nr:hypothetical protein GGR51DRAFT_554467 [Nemania sp. FL0031]
MASPFQRGDHTPQPHESEEMVTINTPSGKQYLVHALTVAHLSDYFRAALNSNFVEGKKREFHLTQHCDDEVMKIFTSWLYLRCTALEYNIGKTCFMQDVTLGIAVKAWLLGDYLLAPKFQNDMIRYIHKGNMATDGPKIIQEFGEQFPEDSTLEKLFVDVFCHLMTIKKLKDPKTMLDWLTPRLHSEVSIELALALIEPQKCRWKVPIHTFHPQYVDEEHEDSKSIAQKPTVSNSSGLGYTGRASGFGF